jgi:uncharacterized membrane protein SpoIIM required for sporulation
VLGVRCWVFGPNRIPNTEHPTPNTQHLSRSVDAGGLIHQPLEEGFWGGGDLVEGVAQEAAEGEGEAAGVGGARFRGEGGAAVEEMADGVQLVGLGEAGGTGRRGDGEAEGGGGFQQQGRTGALADDDGAGGVVSEALVLGAEEDAGDADGRDAGHQVGQPHHIAHHGGAEIDREAGILHHPDAERLLAWRQPVPARFEKEGIAQDDQKKQEDPGGEEPVGQRRAGRGAHGQEQHPHGKDRRALQHGVEEAGEEARPHAGQLVGDLDVLGRQDGNSGRQTMTSSSKVAPGIAAPSAHERARDWRALQGLADRALRSGLQSLASEEVLELGRLYRRAAADLSQARSLGLDPGEAALLNGLVGRAYGVIYTPERGGAASVAAFFASEFPRCLRRNFVFIAASFLISVAGALIGLGAALSNQEAVDVLMGPGWSRSIEQIGERHRAGHNWMPSQERPFMSSFIMTNNIRVAFLAFAGGVLLGLLTIWMLVYNGVMLGAVGVTVARHHTAFEFWGFVAPHGVIELPAIFIAGGAGLMLGYALVNPGEYSRRTALSLAGREAVLLVLGVVAMLVIAGTIEAFFSPTLIPPALKLLVAAVTFAAEITYFAVAGREEAGVGGWELGVGADRLSLTPNPQPLTPAIRPLPPI